MKLTELPDRVLSLRLRATERASQRDEYAVEVLRRELERRLCEADNSATRMEVAAMRPRKPETLQPALAKGFRADEVLPLAEFCRRLGIGVKGWRAMRDAGLRSAKFGRHRFIIGADAVVFFQRLAESEETQDVESCKVPKRDNLQVLSLPLDRRQLSVRALKITNQLDVKTIGELIKKTPDDIYQCKNVGPVTYHEIRDMLEHYGLKLKNDRETLRHTRTTLT